MKNFKSKAALLVLPLLLGSLVGCGGGKSSTSQGSSGGGGDNVKEVTIKFWHTFGQTVIESLQKKAQTFKGLIKDHDGVDVTFEFSYQGSYDDIATKIINGFSAHNRPTIAVAYPDNVADYLEIGKSADTEFVVNLDKYIDDANIGFGKESYLGDKKGKTDFVEDFYSEGSRYAVEGTYSLPYMKSTEIMFYNKQLLNKAMTYYNPELAGQTAKIDKFMKSITWDDFIDLNQAIKDHMDSFPGLEVPFCYDSDANFFITQLFQRNIAYSSIDANGKGHIDFETGKDYDATKAFLEEANDIYQAGLVTTKGIKGTYGSDFFTGEKCVFSIGSSGGSGYNFPQAEAFDLGVCRVPASNDNPIYVSQGPTLALFNSDGLSQDVNAATLKYAWKFMKYITNAEVNTDLCINGSEGYVPVRYSAYETAAFLEFLEEGEEYAKCYQVVTSDINGYLVADAFKGSANLRDVCGALLTAALKVTNKADIPGLIAKAINDAKLKM